MALGFGELFGAIFMGRVVDYLGAKRSSFINVLLILISTLMVLIFLYRGTFTYIAYVMTFLWGFQDSAVSVHLNSILGFEFSSNKEPFSIDIMMESTNVFLFQFIQSQVVSFKARFIYICIVGLLGMGFTLNTYFFDFHLV